MSAYVTGSNSRRGWRWGLLLWSLPVLLVPILAASAGRLAPDAPSGNPTLERWVFEPIPLPPDQARQVADGSAWLDLVIDPVGDAHLVFGGLALTYAHRDGDGWDFQPVGSGAYPSLAIDSGGKLHLTYYDSNAIHYAVRENGEWVIRHAMPAGSSSNSLALDAAGRPHIAYLHPGPDHSVLTYTSQESGGWSESIVTPLWNTGTAGLAVDGDGRPTVVYDRWNSWNFQLVAATLGPDGWQEGLISEYRDFSDFTYEWWPETIQVSGDATGRALVGLIYGARFIIKPGASMTYYADYYRYSPTLTEGLAFASMYSDGYDTLMPDAVALAPGYDDNVFMAYTVDGDLWFGDLEARYWSIIAHAEGALSIAAGPDGRPHIVFANEDGLWYGRRETVELTEGIFLPVIAPLPSDPTGVTLLVSVDSDGNQLIGGDSGAPAVSADGRFVAFESAALLPGGARGFIERPRLLLRDRLAGRTWCISVDTTGACREIAREPAISADGRFVAFETSADLLPDDQDPFGSADIYLYDVAAGRLSLVSATSPLVGDYDDAFNAALSGDGRILAYVHSNGPHRRILVYDRLTGGTETLPDASPSEPGWVESAGPSVSADGRFIAFSHSSDRLLPGDSNGWADIFVYDRQTRALTLASLAPDGGQADGDSSQPRLSADGRYVVFTTAAGNLAPDDDNGALDVYRHDRQTKTTVWISRHAGQPGKPSYAPAISDDGGTVAFESYATFSPADTNGFNDVYLAEVGQALVLISANRQGAAGNSGSATPELTSDGRVVVFKSAAGDLIPRDLSGFVDIYLRRPAPGR